MPGFSPHAFDPRSIKGCVCWLRSDQGVTVSGGVVKRWKDRSGQANDAFDPSTFGPAYTTGALGLPALVFTNDVLQWNLSLTGAKTIMMVVSVNSDPASGNSQTFYRIDGPGTVNITERFESNNAAYLAQICLHDSGSGVTLNTIGYPAAGGLLGGSGLHMLLDTYNGQGDQVLANYNMTQDGAAQTLASSGLAGSAATAQSSIGGRLDSGTGSNFCPNTSFYELLVYNNVIAQRDLMNLRGYAKQRYKF